jgi:hypothetical protein
MGVLRRLGTLIDEAGLGEGRNVSRVFQIPQAAQRFDGAITKVMAAGTQTLSNAEQIELARGVRALQQAMRRDNPDLSAAKAFNHIQKAIEPEFRGNTQAYNEFITNLRAGAQKLNAASQLPSGTGARRAAEDAMGAREASRASRAESPAQAPARSAPPVAGPAARVDTPPAPRIEVPRVEPAETPATANAKRAEAPQLSEREKTRIERLSNPDKYIADTVSDLRAAKTGNTLSKDDFDDLRDALRVRGRFIEGNRPGGNLTPASVLQRLETNPAETMYAAEFSKIKAVSSKSNMTQDQLTTAQAASLNPLNQLQGGIASLVKLPISAFSWAGKGFAWDGLIGGVKRTGVLLGITGGVLVQPLVDVYVGDERDYKGLAGFEFNVKRGIGYINTDYQKELIAKGTAPGADAISADIAAIFTERQKAAPAAQAALNEQKLAEALTASKFTPPISLNGDNAPPPSTTVVASDASLTGEQFRYNLNDGIASKEEIPILQEAWKKATGQKSLSDAFSASTKATPEQLQVFAREAEQIFVQSGSSPEVAAAGARALIRQPSGP